MLEYKPNFGGAAAILQAAAQVIAVAERERLERIAAGAEQQRLADLIPSCYPDGTAILSPEQWLAWALPKLGYTHGVPPCGEGQQ